MPNATPPEVDWQYWLGRWDIQQAGYIPEREERFRVMFAALEALLPDAFVALDLACGPGSLSQRLLDHFPGARCVAVDIDPVMLALGQGALGARDGRLRWVDADIGSPGWLEALGCVRKLSMHFLNLTQVRTRKRLLSDSPLGETQVDAALSTTALHWLPPAQLVALYRDLGRLVRPGGLFFNGDNMAFGPDLPTYQRLAQDATDRDWSDESFAARGIETSEEWWEALSLEPSLTRLLAERERRFASKERPTSPIFDAHVAALREAGFREVGTVWQTGTDRILMAVR